MTRRAPSAGRGGGRRDVIERLWGFFVSLKLTLWLLAALALASAAGAFLNPVPATVADLRARFGSGLAFQLARGLELQDVFHSWWFTLLLWALALNLCACTWERLPRVLGLVLRPDPRLTDEALKGRRHVVELPAAAPAVPIADEAARVERAMRARGFRPRRVVDADGTVHLFAERGRLARLGAHVTHLALLVILLGGIIGRLGGAQGQVAVLGLGGSFEAIPVAAPDGTTFPRPLGFEVQVRDFRLLTLADGRPRQYESDLAVWRGDTLVAQQTISVNHPMRFGGWTFYQSSYEVLPGVSAARLTVTDRLTGKAQTRRLLGDQAIALEDGEGVVQFGVVGWEENHAGAGPAVHMARESDAEVTDFWVLENYPGFDGRNRPDRWSVDFHGLEPVYQTGIQAVRDPGADLVLAGCVLLALGLAQSFYSSHRRLWARVGPKSIVLAGSAHRSPTSFAPVFEAVAERVRTGKI